jgi:hypothetical protein
MPKHIADAGDLYSGFTDLAQWKVATPRLDDTKRRRVAFMAHQLLLAGHWSTYVAAFPIWAKYASHRAVIGKTPYDRPGDANQPHIDSLTALVSVANILDVLLTTTVLATSSRCVCAVLKMLLKCVEEHH